MEKEKSEFKPVKLCFKIDLVPHPAHMKDLSIIYIYIHVGKLKIIYDDVKSAVDNFFQWDQSTATTTKEVCAPYQLKKWFGQNSMRIFKSAYKPISQTSHTHTHTHTRIYIYIYIYIVVGRKSVCVFDF